MVNGVDHVHLCRACLGSFVEEDKLFILLEKKNFNLVYCRVWSNCFKQQRYYFLIVVEVIFYGKKKRKLGK